jgi:hypothetical protein
MTRPDLIIGLDTEYTRADAVDGAAPSRDNAVVSYQAAVLCPETQRRSSFIDFTTGSKRTHRMSMKQFISNAIANAIGQGALGTEATANMNGGKLTVFLCAHFTRADLPGFRDFNRLKRKFDGIRKTYSTTSSPTTLLLRIKTGARTRYIKASVRLIDTMLLAPAGAGSLAKLGNLLGFQKLTIPPVTLHNGAQVPAITRMDLAAQQHRQAFIDYACRDAEIAVEWLLRFTDLAEQWGLAKLPPTIGSLAVNTFLILAAASNIDTDPLLGVIRDAKGKPTSHPTYLRHQSFIASTFHGGRNECFAVGIFDGQFIDLDFAGAYTTALAQFRAFDWDTTITTTDLDALARFDTAAFAEVEFSFPADTRLPCLPVAAGDHGLLYPLTGISFCTGPELAVARDHGATIKVLHGVVIPWDTDDDTRPFVAFTKHINAERARFRQQHGKGSAMELLAKEAGNSLYGKTAQGVADMRPHDIDGLTAKTAFNTRTGSTDTIPASRITQAAIASLTTGLLRAVLSEALMNLPTDSVVISATTDGWLSTASSEQAAAATSGPACSYFATLRSMVSPDGSDTIIEQKHAASRILSMKTRGAVSLAGDGGNPILARAGYRLPNAYDTPAEEAAAFADLYRQRQHDTVLPRSSVVSIRTQWMSNADLYEVNTSTAVNLCYDLKREPTAPCDHDGLIQFITRPWYDLETFNDARDRLDNLRTNHQFVLKQAPDWARYGAAGGQDPRSSHFARTPLQNAVLEALARATDGFPPRRRDGRRGTGTTRRQIADFLTAAGVPAATEDVVRKATNQPLPIGADSNPTPAIDPAAFTPADHILLEAIRLTYPEAHATITTRWLTHTQPPPQASGKPTNRRLKNLLQSTAMTPHWRA